MVACEADRRVFRIVGLDHDPPGPFAAARSAGDLSQELEGALGGTEIR